MLAYSWMFKRGLGSLQEIHSEVQGAFGEVGNFRLRQLKRVLARMPLQPLAPQRQQGSHKPDNRHTSGNTRAMESYSDD